MPPIRNQTQENAVKHEWDKYDIYAGRRVTTSNETEEFIISYFPLISKLEGNYAMVSLRDGMIMTLAGKYLNVFELVDMLNAGGYRPLSLGNPHAKNPFVP